MTAFIDLFASHALLGWMALGALFLVVELATGSGWLLWPAGSAAAVGLVTFDADVTLAGETAIFAALTVISTYVGRRFLGGGVRHGHDVNDPATRLIGREGKAATAFEGGQGRVFVDGKEWSAELDGETPLQAGGRVEVVALVGGARLKVRAA
jgi:membrane protein implicated in regulation of membrane protease activity